MPADPKSPTPAITRERWERVQSLFNDALEHDADVRSAFLRRVCGGDVDLYREVESLLAVEVHSLFAGRAIDAVSPFDASDRGDPRYKGDAAASDLRGALSMEGERVGPYQIIRRLGSGGMGTVYLAERADGQFELTVALKLVKRGMDTESVVQRFQSERQILARLQHPNIGRLLDGGVHDDGRPYFALEYVPGEPITDYCDARALSVNGRLALFEDVCAAVAYAHRNLVVHRDLKPSNILVAVGADVGQDRPRPGVHNARPDPALRAVKLLDFGIAKLLTGDDDMTRTGERILTPAYAAPEQSRGEAVTTATDVYGLGVVLYELLTGRRPSDEKKVSTDAGRAGQARRLSMSGESERPSVAVARESGGNGRHALTPVGVARLRSTTPEKLQRRLRGDLDTIVMKALRQEPERRYASAENLLSDLRAFRHDLPVAAQPESAGYRLRKYVRRHRVGVAATAGAIFIGALLIGFYTFRLADERDRARLEADKSEQVSAFLASLFAIADPAASGGADVTARELLDEGAERIDRELAGQPLVRSEMMQLMGEVYTNIGSYDEAEGLLEQTLDLRREEHGPDAAAVGETLEALGLLYERQGRYHEGARVQQDAVDVLERHVDRDAPRRTSANAILLADALHGLSFMQLRLGDYEAAEQNILEALDIREAVIGDDHPDYAYSLNILGDVLTYLDRYDEAEAVHLRALDMRRRHLGDAHLDVGYTLHNLAATLRHAERYAESERYYREALAVWRRHYGYDHQESANTLSQLAFVVGMQERYDESDSLQQAALDMALGSLGADHPRVAATYVRRGDIEWRAGRLADAEASYRAGVETQRRVLGEGHPTVTRWQIALGRLVALNGRRDEALELIRDSEARCVDPDRGGYDGCAEAVAAAFAEI
jgi:serine/threonine-protein kinase